MTAPKANHWMAAKCVLRYVKGTSDYGLLYSWSSNPKLSGFTDSDWAGSVDDKKSTSGYVFSLGSDSFTWTSKKQQVVSLSSIEAKYRGTAKARCGFVVCLGICRCHQLDQPLCLFVMKALSN